MIVKKKSDFDIGAKDNNHTAFNIERKIIT